ncbi:MAG: hypothetical protein ACPLPX_03295 [Candidatus Kapaibacteriota bacterium]
MKRMRPLKNRTFLSIVIFLISLNITIAQLNKEPVEIVELPNAGLYRQGSLSFRINFSRVDLLRFSFFLSPLNRTFLGLQTNYIFFSANNFHLFLPSLVVKYRILEEDFNLPALALGISTHSLSTNQYIYERFAPTLFLVGSKSFDNYIGICNFHLGYAYSFSFGKSEDKSLVYIGFSQLFLKSFWANFEFYKLVGGNTEIKDNLLNFSAEWVVAENAKIGVVFKDLLKKNPDFILEKYLRVEFGLR